jgi:hypothetical protein
MLFVIELKKKEGEIWILFLFDVYIGEHIDVKQFWSDEQRWWYGEESIWKIHREQRRFPVESDDSCCCKRSRQNITRESCSPTSTDRSYHLNELPMNTVSVNRRSPCVSSSFDFCSTMEENILIEIRDLSAKRRSHRCVENWETSMWRTDGSIIERNFSSSLFFDQFVA